MITLTSVGGAGTGSTITQRRASPDPDRPRTSTARASLGADAAGARLGAAYRGVRWCALLALTGGRSRRGCLRARQHGRRGLPAGCLGHRRRGRARARIPLGRGRARAAAERRWKRRAPGARAVRGSPAHLRGAGDLDGLVGRSALDLRAATTGPRRTSGRASRSTASACSSAPASIRHRRLAAAARAGSTVRRSRDDEQDRRIAAWLELTQWWQWAFERARRRPGIAYGAPVREARRRAGPHLAVARPRRAARRAAVDVLERALAAASRGGGRAARRAGTASRAAAVARCRRCARRSRRSRASPHGSQPCWPSRSAAAGTTEVRLVGSDPAAGAAATVRLAGARCGSHCPTDAFAPLPGDPCDLDALGARSRRTRTAPIPRCARTGCSSCPPTRTGAAACGPSSAS